MPMPIVELETGRLALLQWSEACFEEYARIFSDPALARYIGGAVDRARAWRASLDYAFTELRAETLVSYIDPGNAPSIRVARRLGGVLEKTIPLLDLGSHQVYRHRRPTQEG